MIPAACFDTVLPWRSVVIQQEDDEGKIGVKIGRELMSVAATALKANITRLAPLVLPLSEQLIYAGNFVARKVTPREPSSSAPRTSLRSAACTVHALWQTCWGLHGLMSGGHNGGEGQHHVPVAQGPARL